jgi:hypothetical protein
MSPNTIVAIGGSGTHAVIAFLQLAILSGMEIAQIPNIIIIDGDISPASMEGEASSPSLLEMARKLHNQVVEGCENNTKPAFEHFTPYLGSDAQQSVQVDTSFGDYLIGQSVATAPSGDKKILDALFTRRVPNSEKKSEQEIPLSRGFFARPIVGATAIYDLLNSPQSRLKIILVSHLGNSDNCIAIIGSSTGGTGSGGGPALAQWLMTERRQRKSQAKVALFMTLAWFVPNGANSTKEPSYGDEQTQKLNAAAGVRLYAESNPLKEAAVFLADFNGHRHIRNNDGNYGQPEYPHVFNLMLASQMQNFFIACERADRNAMIGNFTFFHISEQNATGLVIDANDSPLTAFSASRTLRQDIQDWAYETQAIRLSLERVASFIENAYGVNGSISRSLKKQFKELMLELAKKYGDEAIAIEKVGGVFGVAGTKRESAQVRKALVQALRSRSELLSGSVAWLNKLRRNSDTGETKFLLSDASARLTHSENSHKDYPIFNGEKNDNAFVVVLRLFEEAFDETITSKSDRPATRVVQWFSDLITAKNAALLPVDAAAKVIEGQMRAVVQARSSGKSRRSKDFDTWVAAQRSAATLLPMGIATERINHYLAKFAIGKLVDHGEDRSLTSKVISDPTHPFTISNVSSSNIPSPWAAAKLHGWLRIYGDAEQRAASLSCFEAITWGIFTKQLVLCNIPLLENRLGKLLTRSLDAEFDSQRLREMDSLLVACSSNNLDDVIAINHPLVGWYLAPWLIEEASLTGKPRWWKSERINFDLPSEIVRKKQYTSASFPMRQVKSYVGYLAGLAAGHRPDTENMQPIPWHSAVLELSQHLSSFVEGVDEIATVVINNAQFQLRARRQQTGAKFAWDIYGAELLVLKESGDDLLKSYLPEYILLLDNNNDELLYPTLPLLPKHIGKVTAKFRGIKKEDYQGFPYQISYSLSIDGLGTHEVTLPALAETFQTHVVIWPNFKERDWKYYYLGCEPSDTIEQDNNIRFNLYDEAGSLLGKTSHRSFRTNHEIQGVPRYLEIEMLKGSTFASRGLYEINLKALPVASNIFRMGLDIGTSHSSIYAVDNNEHRINALDFSRAAELGHVIFNHAIGAQRFLDELRFLGCFAAREQEQNQCVLPSELRVQRREGEPISELMLNDLTETGKHFSSTPMAFKTGVAMARGRGSEILSDYKWRPQRPWTGKPLHHGLAGTPFESHQEEVLRIYMLQFLRMGLAMLRVQGFKQVKVFRATYPEAFDVLTIKNYAKQLVVLMNELPESTGIELKFSRELNDDTLLSYRNDPARGATAEDSFLLSESLAAIGASKGDVANPLWVPGVCLVLDMGGGTTDVALYVTAQNGADPVQMASITDSIRYAGNDILEVLAVPAVLRVLIQANLPSITDEAISKMTVSERMLTLKRTIRDTKAVDALRAALSNGEIAQEITTAIALFFQGIIEYSGLLIKPYMKKFETEERAMEVSVVLLGNGWYLSDLIWNQDSVPAGGLMNEMKKFLEQKLGSLGSVNVRFRTKETVSVKETIAMGAVSFAPGNTPVARMNPILSVPGFPLVVTVNGSAKEIGAGEFLELNCKPAELIDNIGVGSGTVLSNEMRRHLASVLGVKDADLDQRLAMALKAHIGQFVNSRMHVIHPLRISPLAIFLEGLWKEVIFKVGKRKEI